MFSQGFGNSGVRVHGSWLAVGSRDWPSGLYLCVFLCVLLCSLCQCLKEMIGSWKTRLAFGVCVRVFVLPVFEEHTWQSEEESGVFVQNTWLEARTLNRTSGKRKSFSCVNLPSYHVSSVSVCTFLSWCLRLKHPWMVGGRDHLNQDLSVCLCLSMMLNAVCMFYS